MICLLQLTYARPSTPAHSQKLAQVMDKLKDFEEGLKDKEKVILTVEASLMVPDEEALRFLQDKTFPLHKEFKRLFASKANANVKEVVNEFLEDGTCYPRNMSSYGSSSTSISTRPMLINLYAMNRRGWQFTKLVSNHGSGWNLNFEAIASEDVFDFEIFCSTNEEVPGPTAITIKRDPYTRNWDVRGPAEIKRDKYGKLQHGGSTSTYHSVFVKHIENSESNFYLFIYQRRVSQEEKGPSPEENGPPAYSSGLER